MFAADLESEVIFEVAEALRVPVLVLTVLALGVVLIELGGFAVELMRRRRRDLARLRSVTEQTRKLLAEGGGPERAQETVGQVAWSASMGDTLRVLVGEWGKPEGESMMAKALAEHDFGSLRRLERTRLLVRAGPALGLMGTLIPLSPALAGLAAGDVQELSENLRVAFSVTVIGLLKVALHDRSVLDLRRADRLVLELAGAHAVGGQADRRVRGAAEGDEQGQ